MYTGGVHRRTSRVWDSAARGRQCGVRPCGVGGAEYAGQYDCRLVAARVSAVRDRRLRALTVPAGVQTGKIEDLTLGYTVIKTQENNEIVVPNSVMASQAIIKSV